MNIKILASSSSGNCYIINDQIMIDCGLSIKKIRQKLKFQLHKIKACFITHAHGDHSKAVKDIMKTGINTYVSHETAQILHLSGHRLNIIKPMDQINIDNHIIKSFDLRHDISNMGFLIKHNDNKLLFAVDTNYIPYRFQGLTHIMLSINFDKEILRKNIETGKVDISLGKRILKSHMSLQTALKIFKENDLSKLKEVYILHLSDDNSDAEMFKREVQSITGKPVYYI